MTDQPTIPELLRTASQNAANAISGLELRQQDIATHARYSEGAGPINDALVAMRNVKAEIESRLNES